MWNCAGPWSFRCFAADSASAALSHQQPCARKELEETKIVKLPETNILLEQRKKITNIYDQSPPTSRVKQLLWMLESCSQCNGVLWMVIKDPRQEDLECKVNFHPKKNQSVPARAGLGSWLAGMPQLKVKCSTLCRYHWLPPTSETARRVDQIFIFQFSIYPIPISSNVDCLDWVILKF